MQYIHYAHIDGPYLDGELGAGHGGEYGQASLLQEGGGHGHYADLVHCRAHPISINITVDANSPYL
jgi:hypothetical protein